MTGLLRPAFRPAPLVLFGLLAAALVAVEYVIVHRADFGQRPALPPAVALDLLLTLPAAFYLCVVQPYRLPLRTLAGAFGVGLALSHWLLPAAGLPLLAWAGRLAAVGEVATVGYLLVRLRRMRRGYQLARAQSADFVENLTAAVQPELGRLTAALVTEVAVLRYALLGAWARPEVGPAETPFSAHRTSGFVAMLTTLAGLSVVEMAAAHLVAGHWWPRVAWLLTGLSAYSLLWLLAHGQAVRRRPVLLTATTLVVRVGFVWRVAIPVGQVLEVQKLTDVPPAAPGLLNAARLLLTPPNLLLTLAEPQRVRGLYGRQRLVRRLAIYVDEPAALVRQLAAAAPAARFSPFYWPTPLGPAYSIFPPFPSNMPLKETIDAGIKQAMLAKDKVRLTALRSIKSQILVAETAEGASASGLTPDQEQKLLIKAAKQRRDSAATYKEQFRSDLEETELAELTIIEEFLPQQLTEGELMEKLVSIVQRTGAKGPSDLGKVMGVAARELSGQADGKRISEVVSMLLNNTDF